MGHNIPKNLKYTKEHEWALIEGDTATIGITDYAQSSLGDIVFVELPDVGTQVSHGSSFGVVESIKSVSDLYSPLDGEVVEANNELENTPELINQDPYVNWIVKIKMTDPSQVSSLMEANQYEECCQNA